MKIPVKILIGVLSFSLLLVLGIKGIDSLWSESLQRSKAKEVCEMMTAQAQVGAFRDILEEANKLLQRYFPSQDFLVQIKEGSFTHGNRLSESDRPLYYEQSCTVLGRSDVSIRFLFKKSEWTASTFILNWAFTSMIVFVLGILGYISLDLVQRSFASRLNEELSKALKLTTNTKNPNFFSKWVERLLKYTPTSGQGVKEHVKNLQSRIHEQRDLFISFKELEIRKEEELKRNLTFIEAARQVRHDIRGPLQSIMFAVEGLESDRESQSVLSSSISAIQDILEDLELREEMVDDSPTGVVPHVAEALIQDVVREKRIIAECSNLEISFNIESTFLSVVKVRPSHFRRLVGNLIQNAIEAGSNSGLISVHTFQEENHFVLKVRDHGCGIPDFFKEKLFTSGFTYGKKRGSGLGLSHAKNCIERWNGRILIESKENEGTTVTVYLPLMTNRTQFISRLPNDKSPLTVILDDEHGSYLQIKKQVPGPSVYHSSIKDFKQWEMAAAGEENSVRYIFDYNLKEDQTGLEMLQSLPGESVKILATYDYFRPDVIKASQGNVYVLPKVFL